MTELCTIMVNYTMNYMTKSQILFIPFVPLLEIGQVPPPLNDLSYHCNLRAASIDLSVMTSFCRTPRTPQRLTCPDSHPCLPPVKEMFHIIALLPKKAMLFNGHVYQCLIIILS